jgi:hypothetical protein
MQRRSSKLRFVVVCTSVWIVSLFAAPPPSAVSQEFDQNCFICRFSAFPPGSVCAIANNSDGQLQCTQYEIMVLGSLCITNGDFCYGMIVTG